MLTLTDVELHALRNMLALHGFGYHVKLSHKQFDLLIRVVRDWLDDNDLLCPICKRHLRSDNDVLCSECRHKLDTSPRHFVRTSDLIE